MKSRVTRALTDDIHLGLGRWGVCLTVGRKCLNCLRQEKKMPVLGLEKQVCFPMQVGDTAQREFQEGEQDEQRQGDMEQQHGSFQELKYDWSVGHAGDSKQTSPCCWTSWGTLEQAVFSILEMSPFVQDGSRLDDSRGTFQLWLLLEAVSSTSPTVFKQGVGITEWDSSL